MLHHSASCAELPVSSAATVIRYLCLWVRFLILGHAPLFAVHFVTWMLVTILAPIRTACGPMLISLLLNPSGRGNFVLSYDHTEECSSEDSRVCFGNYCVRTSRNDNLFTDVDDIKSINYRFYRHIRVRKQHMPNNIKTGTPNTKHMLPWLSDSVVV